jgi:hypothetical protein
MQIRLLSDLVSNFGYLNFMFVSSFVLRISDFRHPYRDMSEIHRISCP